MNVGETLYGRYQIQKILGKGGMGMTYKAIDRETNQPVAVKRFHLPRAQDWQPLEMFKRESKLLQQLHHPNIPQYVDYFSIEPAPDRQFVLVQEYIQGTSLQQLIEEGGEYSQEEIRAITLQLVAILEYLHVLKPPVIHRDLNPKNVILTSEKRVYLVDFGAMQAKARMSAIEGTIIVGAFGYTPFEQFRGHAVPASDFYALGATLLFMLTKKHPSVILTRPRKTRFDEVLQISPLMARLLNGLLEHALEHRIATGREVRRILEEDALAASEKSGTIIKKILKKNHLVRFQFFQKGEATGATRLAWGLLAIFLVTIAVFFSVPVTKFLMRSLSANPALVLNSSFWLREAGLMVLLNTICLWFGTKLLYSSLFDITRGVVLDLTKDQVRIRDNYGEAALPFDILERVGISNRSSEKGSPISVLSFYPEGGKHPVQIRLKFTYFEGAQLMQDIKEAYFTAFGKSLPM